MAPADMAGAGKHIYSITEYTACFFVYGDDEMNCSSRIREMWESIRMNRKDF